LLSKFQTGSCGAALFCYQNKKYYFRGVIKICTMAATTTLKPNKTKSRLNSVLVTYDVKNKIANNLLYVLSQTKGVEIDDDAILTDEEIMLIEKSRKSGTASLDELEKFLRQ